MSSRSRSAISCTASGASEATVPSGTHVTKLRYTIVSVISYVLNTFWVWLIFTRLELGPEVPIIPMLFVTPAVTFILNRQWVFR